MNLLQKLLHKHEVKKDLLQPAEAPYWEDIYLVTCANCRSLKRLEFDYRPDLKSSHRDMGMSNIR